jgi:hypothetical protein
VASKPAVKSVKKQRLEHVDAMRPIKQLGVVANHSFIFFAPTASILAASSVLLLHVTREAFLFISACMLAYAYPALQRKDLGRFYKRRFLNVGVPYICWTVIYFILSFRTGPQNLKSFMFDLGTGYYQLYFLVLLMQFYLVFPLLQKCILRTSKYHGRLVLISLVVQVIYISLMHWSVLPYWLQNNWANRELMSYQFYLIGGMVAAYHFDAFHTWVIEHAKLILTATLVSAIVAVSWVVIAGVGHVSGFGYESDPFQPIVIPFNIGAILSVYLLGIWLVQHAEGSWIRRATTSGANNSYGVYTSQLVFLNCLLWYGLGPSGMPWLLKVAIAIVVTYGGSWLLTAILARTPLAKALTGRTRETWSSLIPTSWRLPASPADAT